MGHHVYVAHTFLAAFTRKCLDSIVAENLSPAHVSLFEYINWKLQDLYSWKCLDSIVAENLSPAHVSVFEYINWKLLDLYSFGFKGQLALKVAVHFIKSYN